MVRLLIFLALLCLAALGLTWLADHPGQVELTWGGYRVEASAMVALGFVVVLAIALGVVWAIIRFVFRLPSLVSLARRARRREKGMEALSRGMVAVGSGDVRAARRHAQEAHRLIGGEPLTLLLRAQAAQLAGDRASAEAAFKDMLDKQHTHALGLRGLHVEARRRGDHEAALDYAVRAQRRAPLPWAGQAVLDHRAAEGDWAGALATVEANASAGLIDKPTANRWRAVLKTALAEERALREPQAASALAQEALRLAPDLAPAAALAGRLTAAHGDYRRASKIIETAYAKTPHPDLAAIYLRMRPGDSAKDRLARARALARVLPNDPESRLTLARAALDARDFEAAREAIAPLLGAEAPSGRPSVRVCLFMADLEETEGVSPAAAREWLARASRAPRDRAWVAEGLISDVWAPASPSGKLDAFVWRVPDERLSAPIEAPPSEAPAAGPPRLSRDEALAAPIAAAPVVVAPPKESRPPERSDEASGRGTNPSLSANASLPPAPLPPPGPPDDPGAHEATERKGGFRSLFS
ncbi:MAG TPA: heme biosynthesis HemY N-terminal domain-containing protein [Roseiarcus sp.]|nr:heme biosynthesis HemY N-terminal domain-containing protein [Roseiarcus sp.]